MYASEALSPVPSTIKRKNCKEQRQRKPCLLSSVSAPYADPSTCLGTEVLLAPEIESKSNQCYQWGQSGELT